MTYLIADDSDPFRASLKKLLSLQSDTDCVDSASSISEAIQKIQSNTPDILFLDLMFPEGSGFEVLEVAVKNKAIKAIIVLTNFPHEKLKLKSFEIGADYFFDKSSDTNDIVDVVNQITNRAV